MTTMHYWPVAGAFGCPATTGFRTSDAEKVTCKPCREGLAAPKTGWPHERYGPAPVPVNAGKDGVKLPDETALNLDELRARERNANEQGEPSTLGTWYLLSVADLVRDGYDAIEVHYPDTDDADGPPNAIVLHKGVFA